MATRVFSFWPPALWLTGWMLVAALAGCDRPGSDPKVIRIGVLVNFSGSEGPPNTKTAELAAESVNADGGLEIDGRRYRVELLYEDTRAVPAQAVTGARRLIQRDVAAIVGPGRSRDAIAVAAVVENARIPMISASATHPETTAGRRYVFRVGFTDTFQGAALGRFAAEALGAGSAAALYDVTNAYNSHLASVFRQAFEKAGGTMVGFETYTGAESEYHQQLARIRDAAPQVLFLPNYNEEIPEQARQARRLGIDAILLGSDSWSLISSYGQPQLEGAFFARDWHPDEAGSGAPAQRFITAFRDAYGETPSGLEALTFDAYGLLFHAIGNAGGDPDAIRQALAEIEEYEGVTGTITFRGHGGDPPKRLFIVQIRQGEPVLYAEIDPGA